MTRFFNTAGPVNVAKHYAIEPFARLSRDDVLGLIAQEKYFVLHAPRQTGKTSALLALVDLLNREGRYTAVYANVEPAQTARDDVASAMRVIMGAVASGLRHTPGHGSIVDDVEAMIDTASHSRTGHGALVEFLSQWCVASDRPVVLVLDEIDSLVGDVLVSVLRQLRAGYHLRPAQFPQTVMLCGVRDVRDYRIHTSAHEIITGGSAFNVRAESLRLGDFGEDELRQLYGQHTTETGQTFDEDALSLAWELTCGQPWLVNALAYEVCFKMPAGRDRTQPITALLLSEAKDRLVSRRETHLDQLVDKLKEPRVHRVVAPLLAGVPNIEGVSSYDFEYSVDLGLIREGRDGPEIANAIYREVIPRELTAMAQREISASHRQAWFIDTNSGRLKVPKLLEAFQQFFRENSEHWMQRFDYHEAGPQLLLQAFLQRVVNGGGRIDREYGLGRGRTDLLIRWPTTEQGFYGAPGSIQTAVIELKVLSASQHKSLEHTLETGLEQTASYLQRTGAAEGHLVIFDRRPEVSWDDKIFVRQEGVPAGSGQRHADADSSEPSITVWGM